MTRFPGVVDLRISIFIFDPWTWLALDTQIQLSFVISFNFTVLATTYSDKNENIITPNTSGVAHEKVNVIDCHWRKWTKYPLWSLILDPVMMKHSNNELRIYKINPQTNKPQNNLKGVNDKMGVSQKNT